MEKGREGLRQGGKGGGIEKKREKEDRQIATVHFILPWTQLGSQNNSSQLYAMLVSMGQIASGDSAQQREACV